MSYNFLFLTRKEWGKRRKKGVKKVKQLSVIERVTCSNRKRKLHAIIDIVSLDQALSEIWGVEVTHLETQLRKGRTHDT